MLLCRDLIENDCGRRFDTESKGVWQDTQTRLGLAYTGLLLEIVPALELRSSTSSSLKFTTQDSPRRFQRRLCHSSCQISS